MLHYFLRGIVPQYIIAMSLALETARLVSYETGATVEKGEKGGRVSYNNLGREILSPLHYR